MRVALCVALLAIAPPAVGAEVYRCVTENGVVRYSDKPCSDGKVDKLAIDNKPTDPAAVEQQAQQRRQQLAEIEKSEKEAARAAEAAANEAAEKEKQCAAARKRLQELLGARRVTVTEDGEQKYLESDEIVRRRQEAQDKVDALCDK